MLTAEKGHREHALSERRLGLALRKRLVTQSFSHRCPSLTVQTRASVRHARDGRTEGWPATYCEAFPVEKVRQASCRCER